MTRSILRELHHVLTGRAVMYVDDIIDEVAADMAKTRDVCTGLLGSSAVADDKTEVGRRLEILSYTVCLDSKLVVD